MTAGPAHAQVNLPPHCVGLTAACQRLERREKEDRQEKMETKVGTLWRFYGGLTSQVSDATVVHRRAHQGLLRREVKGGEGAGEGGG